MPRTDICVHWQHQNCDFRALPVSTVSVQRENTERETERENVERESRMSMRNLCLERRERDRERENVERNPERENQRERIRERECIERVSVHTRVPVDASWARLDILHTSSCHSLCKVCFCWSTLPDLSAPDQAQPQVHQAQLQVHSGALRVSGLLSRLLELWLLHAPPITSRDQFGTRQN